MEFQEWATARIVAHVRSRYFQAEFPLLGLALFDVWIGNQTYRPTKKMIEYTFNSCTVYIHVSYLTYLPSNQY